MRPNTGEPSHTSSKTSLNTTRRSLLGQLWADSFSSFWVWREHTRRHTRTHAPSQQVEIQMWVCGMFFFFGPCTFWSLKLPHHSKWKDEQSPLARILTVCSFRSCTSATCMPPRSRRLVSAFLINFGFSRPSSFTSFWSDRFVQTCCFLPGSDEEQGLCCEKGPLGGARADFEGRWPRHTSCPLCDECSVVWSFTDLKTPFSGKTVPEENSEGDFLISLFCTEAGDFVSFARGTGVSSRLWDVLHKDPLFSLWSRSWFRTLGPGWFNATVPVFWSASDSCSTLCMLLPEHRGFGLLRLHVASQVDQCLGEVC